MQCVYFFHINYNKFSGTNRITIGYIRRLAEYRVYSNLTRTAVLQFTESLSKCFVDGGDEQRTVMQESRRASCFTVRGHAMPSEGFARRDGGGGYLSWVATL